MKRIVRLTETDLVRLVKSVISEQMSPTANHNVKGTSSVVGDDEYLSQPLKKTSSLYYWGSPIEPQIRIQISPQNRMPRQIIDVRGYKKSEGGWLDKSVSNCQFIGHERLANVPDAYFRIYCDQENKIFIQTMGKFEINNQDYNKLKKVCNC
jgi:hypothetical protein